MVAAHRAFASLSLLLVLALPGPRAGSGPGPLSESSEARPAFPASLSCSVALKLPEPRAAMFGHRDRDCHAGGDTVALRGSVPFDSA